MSRGRLMLNKDAKQHCYIDDSRKAVFNKLICYL